MTGDNLPNIVGSTMRSVTVNLNNRCPLRCRHCSMGYSEGYGGDQSRISSDDLLRIISSINPEFYDMVLLAGGEPSLDVHLVAEAIAACKSRQLLCAIVTAPIWASSTERAERFLDQVKGLDILILSFDLYHLEYLRRDYYERAIRLANSLRLLVVLQMVVSNEREKLELEEQMLHIKGSYRSNCSPIVRVGNARGGTALDVRETLVKKIEDFSRIVRSCTLGNSLVDESGNVHGCCWARSAEKSPFSLMVENGQLEETFEYLEANKLFLAMRARGFLDSLTTEGKNDLLRRVRGRVFASECDICLVLMNESSEQDWPEYMDASTLWEKSFRQT